jgi:hypothetical protein
LFTGFAKAGHADEQGKSLRDWLAQRPCYFFSAGGAVLDGAAGADVLAAGGAVELLAGGVAVLAGGVVVDAGGVVPVAGAVVPVPAGVVVELVGGESGKFVDGVTGAVAALPSTSP